MPAIQFAHLIWASTSRRALARATKKKPYMKEVGGWSIRDIANEAARKPGACPHVEKPCPPSLLYGCDLAAMVEIAEKWGRQAKTASGGKYRKNQPIAACGVFSCPGDFAHLWEDAKVSFIDYLRRHYEDRLITVIEHSDESHPHVHFYLIPRDGESFGIVHPGYQESRAARKRLPKAGEGGNTLTDNTPPKAGRGPGFEIGARFREAMHQWQDDIYTKVCEPLGFMRISPNPKPRKSRATVMRERSMNAKRQRSQPQDSGQSPPTSYIDQEAPPPIQEQVFIAPPAGNAPPVQTPGTVERTPSRNLQPASSPIAPFELGKLAKATQPLAESRDRHDAKTSTSMKEGDRIDTRPNPPNPDANLLNRRATAQGRRGRLGAPRPTATATNDLHPPRAYSQPPKASSHATAVSPPSQGEDGNDDDDREDDGDIGERER